MSFLLHVVEVRGMKLKGPRKITVTILPFLALLLLFVTCLFVIVFFFLHSTYTHFRREKIAFSKYMRPEWYIYLLVPCKVKYSLHLNNTIINNYRCMPDTIRLVLSQTLTNIAISPSLPYLISLQEWARNTKQDRPVSIPIYES